MNVLFKPGWDAKIFAIKPKMYSLGYEVHQLVDNTFDKIYCLGRFKLTFEYTSFSFFVFVIWKLNSEGKKKRQSNSSYMEAQRHNFP